MRKTKYSLDGDGRWKNRIVVSLASSACITNFVESFGKGANTLYDKHKRDTTILTITKEKGGFGRGEMVGIMLHRRRRDKKMKLQKTGGGGGGQ
jgi:hypothetical protein